MRRGSRRKRRVRRGRVCEEKKDGEERGKVRRGGWVREDEERIGRGREKVG